MLRSFNLSARLGLLMAACALLSIPLIATAQTAAPQAPAGGYGGMRNAMPARPADKDYDLLLKGGHVIDDKNHIDAIMDVAIADGKIAKVAKMIPASKAIKTVDVTGLYVTPGLIDLHTHVFVGNDINQYRDGTWSVPPDGFTLRVGVTTIVDAGTSGWRNFEVFKGRIIDHSITRVLAELNIVGDGMGEHEQNTDDMDGKLTGALALKYPGVIVGVKSAHYTGGDWKPYDQAEIAGTMAHIPVMIDYGSRRIERPLYQLLEEKLRPGDIYTHMYGGSRGEQDSTTGGPGKGMWEGRQRGVYFDVGHGQSSFYFSVAIPLIKAGFVPDSISTDLHVDSMNAGMKDEDNVGDKFLAMGLPLKEVIADMTWHPAREMQLASHGLDLGNLSVGAIADVAVFGMRTGHFGFTDGGGALLYGTKKLECELTIKDGKFVYDLNGREFKPWNVPPDDADRLSRRWTSLRVAAFGGNPRPITATGAAGAARPAGQGGQGGQGGAQRQPQPRWSAYNADANGKFTVRPDAKGPVAPGKAKYPPAVTLETSPSDVWPAKQSSN